MRHVVTCRGRAWLGVTVARRRTGLLVAALILTGLSMRTAVTSVGAMLDQLQGALGMSGVASGMVTTLPVVCFAVIGAATPRLAHRVGAHLLLASALATMTVGLLARAVATSVWEFIPLSVLALTGGAVANIMMPSLVKRHFPGHIGLMTALYTTAMAVGTTAGAGLTVPFALMAGNWRTGLASWALFSAVAVLPWLPTLRRDQLSQPGQPSHQFHPDRPEVRATSPWSLLHCPLAWILTVFFAAQSFQAYIAFGWFAEFFVAHGMTDAAAGWLVAAYAAVQIPVSMIVPTLTSRAARPLVVVLSASALAAYLGLTLAPVAGGWLWMVLAGIGVGLFPVALTLIGLRSRHPQTTAALSAFVQSIGYVIAGSGPLLFGLIEDATGGWSLPLALLFIALGVAVLAGWLAGGPGYVDDQLAAGPMRGRGASPRRGRGTGG